MAEESKTIFWDRHEAALLIDLCIRVRKGEIKRTDGLAQLSAKLRRRAELTERKVTGDFRSVEQLAKYYAMVEYLVTDGLRGEPTAAPIIVSVYRTYVNDPEEFKKILDEAEHQCRQKVFEFDTHEVIKMVEASVKLNTLENIGEAINELSKLLQEYAKKRGVDDSDTSRDAAAIAKRINVIDGLRRGRQSDSANPKEVFLVRLYKYDPDKFNALLAEANRVLGIATVMPSREKLNAVLMANFPGGFQFHSSTARKLFRHYADEEDELRDITDEQLIDALKEITVEFGDKLFLPLNERQSQIMQEIQAVVTGLLEQGYTCIYAEKIFERYADRLSEVLHINNATDLMSRMGWEKNIISRGNPDMISDVQRLFRNEMRQISLDELARVFWFVPLDKLKSALNAAPHVICVKPNIYMDLDVFPIDRASLPKIEALLKHVLQFGQTISLEECRKIICRTFPEIEAATSEFSSQGFGGALRGLFGNKFSFNRNTISLASEIVSKRQLFVEYCSEHERFTLEELQAFAEEINSQIEFKSVRRVSIRISSNQFLHRDKIKFDVEAIDAVLDGLIEDCRSIKSLATHFHQFPPLENLEWNEYILESYLYCFSDKFELINSVFSKISWGGAAGRKELHLVFEDVAERILAKSDRWHDRESALDLLVSEKILLRRAFKDIDEVIRRLRAEFD